MARLLASVCLCSFTFASVAHGARFITLGTLPAGSSRAADVSADGKIVVGQGFYGQGTGNGGDSAFRWTEESGIQFLVDGPNKGAYYSATAISPNGEVIAGTLDYVGGGVYPGFKWTQSSGVIPITPRLSPPTALSYDGSVIVGGSGGVGGLTYDVSWSGNVVVGSGSGEAFRDKGGIRTWLGGMPEGTYGSEVRAVSADGVIVVGQNLVSMQFNGEQSPRPRPFYWTDQTGMVALGPTSFGIATDTSRTGLVVVGNGGTSFAIPVPDDAFRWTPARGMESVTALLLAEGIDVAAMGLLLNGDDVSISANGRVIVGTAMTSQFSEIAWLAEIAVPGELDEDGDVDGNDFLVWQRGLGTTYEAADLADWLANMEFFRSIGPQPIALSVPEPATWGMILFTAAVIHVGRLQGVRASTLIARIEKR